MTAHVDHHSYRHTGAGTDTTWMADARCRDAGPALFFPGECADYHQRVAQAVAVYGLCPVRIECRAWATETGQDDGIWGGADFTQSRRWRATQLRYKQRENQRARDAG